MTSLPPDSPPGTGRPPRAAATLVVVRDAPQGGIEVLLLLRAERGDHNSGAWVFLGGLVDAGDRASHACCAGLDDAAASARLGVTGGGLDFHLAALRECFEECGLLFAAGAHGDPVSPHAVHALQHWRTPLHRGERRLHELCEASGLRLAVDRLAYLSHWLTPVGYPKRFDTRFFIAAAPASQVAVHDGIEMTAHQWLAPTEALARGDALKLMGPTRATLQALARFASSEAALAWAASQREIPRILPRIGLAARGRRPLLPHEPAWAELGRLDPEGRGQASCEIVPGRPVPLSWRVIRVTAPNAGVMTGPGTNSYLVGGARNEWAVIDPGPLDEGHVQALLDAAPGPVRWILATHTHWDHSPAAALLKARTGAMLCGQVARHPQRQDPSFVPDRVLMDGERLALAPDTTLRVFHTPGHASNHLCLLLEEEQTLFTGDHVMQGSTVVIDPPDGDMAAYIASLRALSAASAGRIEWLAPGHGFLMEAPQRVFDAIVRHRLQREAKLLQALLELGAATEAALLARVYDDVPPALHGVARRSLLAHLLKLEAEGAARRDDERWISAPA